MDDETDNNVVVYIYDLTAGLAKVFSGPLLGKELDGIWHTGVVAYGREYFFGHEGIQSCHPGGTILGEPTRIERIGQTEVPYQLFLEYVFGLGESSFTPESYNLIKHNCNNFADEVVSFLCGHGIPKYILTLPDEILNTSLGQTVAPLLASLSLKADPSDTGPTLETSGGHLQNYQPGRRREDSPEFLLLNQQVEQIRKEGQLLSERRCSLNEKLQKFERKQKKRDEKKQHKKKKKSKRTESSEELLSPGEELTTPDQPSPRSDADLSPSRTQHPLDGVTYSESAEEDRRSGDGEEERARADHSSSPADQQEPRAVPHPVTETSKHKPPTAAAAAVAASSGRMSDQGDEVSPPRESRPPPPGSDQDTEPEPPKPRIPPITYRDAIADVQAEFSGLEGAVGSALSPEEQQNLAELKQYLLEDEGAWALGENFINFLGRILHDKSLPPAARVHLLHLLAVSTLKDDFILILHQDRREHVLMNYADDVDRLPPEEQEALTLTYCNMFDQSSSSEWLLYISEWQSPNNNTPISNIRVTTKVAVNALLSDSTSMQERGTAMMYNLAVKEKFRTNMDVRKLMPSGSLNKVFDDVATELAMAILQYFQGSPSEEQAFRCMRALAKFAQVSYNDVPQLIKMIGPEPSKFRGKSERIDELVDELDTRLARVHM